MGQSITPTKKKNEGPHQISSLCNNLIIYKNNTKAII